MDLFSNKLIVQVLANDSNTRSNKRRIIVDTDDDIKEVPKLSTIREKKILVKRVEKKSTKVSVPISGLVARPSPDIQAILMNTNIIISTLYLLQISPKFPEETRRLMTAPQRPYKKKVIPPTIPSKDDENKPYVRAENLIRI